jgi:hypothetical protein
VFIGGESIKELSSPGLSDMNLIDRSFDQSERSRCSGPRRLSAIIGRLIMTRISTFCVISSTLAVLALAANGASAATLTPHINTPTPKVAVHTPQNVTSGGHYDLGSGALTGRRNHEPLDRAPPVDKASPLNWAK